MVREVAPGGTENGQDWPGGRRQQEQGRDQAPRAAKAVGSLVRTAPGPNITPKVNSRVKLSDPRQMCSVAERFHPWA